MPPAALPRGEPLTTELDLEFLSILLQREALNEEGLVIVKYRMASRTAGKTLAEFVVDSALHVANPTRGEMAIGLSELP